ncbi:MAG: hypothetical protein ACNA7U_04995 [Candidatus Izemoplasmataceae bacterium]
MFETLNRKKTNSIKWNYGEKETVTDDYLVFSVADSDYQTAEVIKERLIKRIEHGAFGYTEVGSDYYTIYIN